MNLFESNVNGSLLSPVKHSVKKFSSRKTWTNILGRRRKNLNSTPDRDSENSTISCRSDCGKINTQSYTNIDQAEGNLEGEATLNNLTYENFEAVLKDRRPVAANNPGEDISAPELENSTTNLESSANFSVPKTENTRKEKKGIFRLKFTNKDKKLVVKNVYDTGNDAENSSLHVDAKKEFITERFIVNMYESPRRRGAPLRTPICKSTNRIKLSESVNDYSIDWERNFQTDNRVNDDPITCGSNNDLDVSFTSSFGSEDSLSELISDDEDIGEITFNGTDDDTHFESFDYLRRRRNEQCRVIRELTQAMKFLRRQPRNYHVDAILQAERGLLLSTERCSNFMTNMTNPDFELDPNLEASGTVVISNIKIPLIAGFENTPNTYYVCTVSSGITCFATKYTKPKGQEVEKYLNFKDEFVFDKLDENFRIEIKVYVYQLKFDKKKRPAQRKKRNPPAVKVYYNNHVMAPIEKNEYFQPAFKQCGAFEISMATYKKQVKNYFHESRVGNLASIDWNVSKISLRSDGKKKGFLHVGQRHAEHEMIVWNIKYVVLDESELRIFNCPSEQDKEPILTLDLKDIANEIVAHSCHLKYCLQLDIVYANWDSGEAILFPYYFRAITWTDFKNWIQQLTYVITMHKQWHLLPFVSD